MSRVKFLMLFSCLFLVGCSGDGKPPTYPVRGKVLYQMQPLAEAQLVLHPVVPHSAGTPQPIAYSNAQGEFEFTTFKGNDGAPAGDYVITVELREQRQVGEEFVRDGRNLLPERYRSPQASDLRCTVNIGTNELPPLQLTSR